MFKKVHIHFALFLTVVGAIIMTVMSIMYIYLSYSSLYKNAMLNFENNMSMFLISFQKDPLISYDKVLGMESSYKYIFYLYDNDVPLQFTRNTKTQEQQTFIKDVQKYYKQTYDAQTDNENSSNHKEFKYSVSDSRYYIGVITLAGERSRSEIYVVFPLEGLRDQIFVMSIKFAAIILISVIILFLFSMMYTRSILRPIQENQKNQSRFIAAASHEIRNPVNTILSALNAMKKCNEAEHQEFIDIAVKEGKRLKFLTNDLLVLAKSDNNSFRIDFSHAEVDTLLIDCYEAFLQPARDKKIRMLIELPEESCVCEHIDSQRIKEVISILLDNAISYTNEGGKIIIRCTESDDKYCIQIIDNGAGVDDTQKKYIFERFYRADSSRENNSHFGLGLSIAKEIIDLHHGSITVSDTQGGGSTFTVTLLK